MTASNLIRVLDQIRTPGAGIIDVLAFALDGAKPPGFRKAYAIPFASSELNSAREIIATFLAT